MQENTQITNQLPNQEIKRTIRIENHNAALGIVSALLIIVGIALSSLLLNLTLENTLFISGLLAIFYAILLIALIMTGKVKNIQENIPIQPNEIKDKIEIPKYDFVGSTQTRTYHKRSCRLAKLIKVKYKLSDNNVSFFTSKKFKPCKICVKKQDKKS